MQTLFRTTGRHFFLEDAEGKPVPGQMAHIANPVIVDVKYELRPSPQQSLVVDIYSRGPMGFGQTKEKLVLDNGVELIGRTLGGSIRAGESRVNKLRMVDIEQDLLKLDPVRAVESPSDIDAAVFGVVSTWPLGSGSCANGLARPGHPFSFTESASKLKKVSSRALRLHHNDLELTLVGTTEYWRALVDPASLQHDSIVGVRNRDGGVLSWKDFDALAKLLPNFIGWLNHCVAPIFHVKGYRNGRLVYKAYNLDPHATVQRDAFSWFPTFAEEDANGSVGSNADSLQDALTAFASAWDDSAKNNGAFHIALQFLRSKEKGSPASSASLLYLRDAFSACGILVAMLTGSKPKRSRRKTILDGLRRIGLKDELPIGEWRERLETRHPELWWDIHKTVVAQEVGTLSRSLANVENWLLHLENADNARALLALNRDYPVQRYFTEVAMWLADLMTLKVIGYEGIYFNRLTMNTERVPWAAAP